MRFGLTRWAAVIAAMLLGEGQLRAQAVELTRNYDEANGPTSVQATTFEETAAPAAGATDCGNCGHCDQCCDRCWIPPAADHCPRFGLYLFSGFESWRGVSEGSGPNNNGIFSGLNAGIPLLSQLGIGAQAGINTGIYDLMGRPTNGADEANQVQQQYIITYGFFRRADCDMPISAGVVQDWMINNNFGTTSNEPTLSQWRAQVGYALGAANEIGVWTAWRDRGATQGAASFRAITQTNVFWHHKWCYGGADSWVWFGVPAYGRLDAANGGSIGEFTVGGMFNMPVNDRLALFTNLQYMKPSARPGVVGSTEEFFDLGVGLAFYPGGTARSRTVAGRSWMPLMPVANNGSFLVDRNF